MAFEGRLLRNLARTMNRVAVSVGRSYFSPRSLWFCFLCLQESLVGVFCFIHINTSLVQVEFSFISDINTFSFKKSCMLSLVPKTLLTATKNGLAPQPSRHTCLLKVLFPTGLHRLDISSSPPAKLPDPQTGNQISLFINIQCGNGFC